ncbi:MAG: hypothetical protein QXN62_09000 [Candidatus Bathyarchaeia archaeon]|nr:hypothetical protein [Candidatus Bathyarchaeota archaeon]
MTSGKLSLAALLIVVILSTVSPLPLKEAKAVLADKIYGDPSDGHIDSSGLVDDSVNFYGIGDDNMNRYIRGFVKFSLSGISGKLSTATLNLYVLGSWKDSSDDYISPLTNPDLGDFLVIHIADYGSTLDFGDFNAPSIGNDPGVLISSTATPNVGYVSIDVKAAMQDDIDNNRAWSTFMIKLAIDTDNDGKWDRWVLSSVDQTGTAQDPFIEYTLQAPAPTPRPVGGVVLSTNKLEIVTPYIALAGLVIAVSAVLVKKRRY